MRITFAVLALAACTSSSSDDTTPGFTVTSKPVTLQPGEETTYCYYFHTPNTETLAVSKWISDLETGSHHMIMFFGDANQPPDGTITSENCGGMGGGGSAPVWIFAAQMEHVEFDLPDDDGTGKPIAMRVPPHQPAYMQIHYLNASDHPIEAPVRLEAVALPSGTDFTETAAFITYNNSIDIPAHAVGDLESQTCTVPAGAKFWLLSTHAHKQAVRTEVKDGTSSVFASSDWEHPGQTGWQTAPFYSFASNKLTYECTYANLGANADRAIHTGPSASTDEMCMALGYFFPANAPKFCFDSQGPF